MPEKIYHCQKISDFPAGWGQVIQYPTNEATFHSDIFSYWDGMASLKIDGEAGIGWFEVRRRSFTGNEVERHRLTPEALLCIQGNAVCFVGEPVDPENWCFLYGAGKRVHLFSWNLACDSFSHNRKGGFLGHLPQRNRLKRSGGLEP
jgi:hypothetical protein